MSALPIGTLSEVLVVFALLLPLVYIFGIIIKNTYTAFGPKDLGKLLMLTSVISWLIPWIIMQYFDVVGITLVAMILVIILNIFGARRSDKRKTAAITGAQVRSGGSS